MSRWRGEDRGRAAWRWRRIGSGAAAPRQPRAAIVAVLARGAGGELCTMAAVVALAVPGERARVQAPASARRSRGRWRWIRRCDRRRQRGGRERATALGTWAAIVAVLTRIARRIFSTRAAVVAIAVARKLARVEARLAAGRRRRRREPTGTWIRDRERHGPTRAIVEGVRLTEDAVAVIELEGDAVPAVPKAVLHGERAGLQGEEGPRCCAVAAAVGYGPVVAAARDGPRDLTRVRAAVDNHTGLECAGGRRRHRRRRVWRWNRSERWGHDCQWRRRRQRKIRWRGVWIGGYRRRHRRRWRGGGKARGGIWHEERAGPM